MRVVEETMEGLSVPAIQKNGHSGWGSLGRALGAGALVWGILPLVSVVADRGSAGSALIWATATGIFVLPAILLVLWPLDYFLPRSNRLWHPGWMALLGAISGAAFFLIIVMGMAALEGGAIRGRLGQNLLASVVCGGGYGAPMGFALAIFNRKRK